MEWEDIPSQLKTPNFTIPCETIQEDFIDLTKDSDNESEHLTEVITGIPENMQVDENTAIDINKELDNTLFPSEKENLMAELALSHSSSSSSCSSISSTSSSSSSSSSSSDDESIPDEEKSQNQNECPSASPVRRVIISTEASTVGQKDSDTSDESIN